MIRHLRLQGEMGEEERKVEDWGPEGLINHEKDVPEREQT